MLPQRRTDRRRGVGVAGLEKGSGTTGKESVGTISDAQLTEIAQTKMPDLNANDIDAAKKIIAGTARSMGVDVA